MKRRKTQFLILVNSSLILINPSGILPFYALKPVFPGSSCTDNSNFQRAKPFP